MLNLEEINENNIISPFSWKPKDFNLNCNEIMKGNSNIIENAIKQRYIMKNLPYYYNLSCEGIKSRGYYPKDSQSFIEKNYPIAYARNVFSDYHLLELQFLLTYAPQNHYCFAVDKKALSIRKKLESLTKCFDNVYITSKSLDMTSGGKNQALSSYECMKILSNKKWEYLFILQNYDFPLKTNLEMVKILIARNGSMDIGFTNPGSLINSRIDKSKSWDHISLNFMKDNDLKKFDIKMLKKSMTFQKGYYPNGLPRISVDYLLNKINITSYLNQINTGRYGEDEMVWQTLFNDAILQIPQWVHENCVSKYYSEDTYMVRFAIWTANNCKSKLFSHSLCVIGIEMLNDLKNNPKMFAYKFKGDQDMGAALCYAEYLYNKTYIEKLSDIDIEYYKTLPQTQYQNTYGRNKKILLDECIKTKIW
uniref:Glycosyltransferase n=1 Tax=Parastrongyloides trichosuri TaxID=131310 RepID=A0A0N4ZRR8_PARTI